MFKEILGHGGFSYVRLAHEIGKEDTPSNHVAIKSILKDNLDSINQVKLELDVL